MATTQNSRRSSSTRSSANRSSSTRSSSTRSSGTTRSRNASSSRARNTSARNNQTQVQNRATGKKAQATRQTNEARSAAKSTRNSARNTGRNAARTAAASANAAETRLEGIALTAERGLLIGVGAALTARDNVVETVKPYTRTETALRKAKVDVRKFERRGTTARNRLEREVKRTRTRVERQLRQASGDVRNGNLTKVPTRLQTAASAVAQDVSKQVTNLV
jgi:hypothetical protein